MTSMLARKRFFHQDSGSSHSTTDLPLLNQTSSSSSTETEPYRCESPPISGGFCSSGNLYAMDYSRIIPGRASSMSIVRQRSGQSLSPQTKNRPRKSVSMFFSSSTPSASSSGSQSDSSIDYNHHATSTYGMLNPGPLVRTNSGSNHHHNNSLSNWITTLVAIMGILTLSVLAASTWQHNTHLHHELMFKDQEIEMHLEHAHALERRVQSMRSETIHLHNRIEELEHPEPTEEELNIQRKVFHLEHYQEQLHRGIAEQSKRLVTEKFGPGPKYYVEVKLAFDSNSNIVQDATTEIEDTIWLETAHIDEMPHTVHFFLEQVANGVYDGTAFYRNAPRFVQAGPGVDPHRQQELESNQPSLAHVLFQEHSPKLNHQQYTLGYPGRPGGPDFYLNLQDNSDQHGLGAAPTSRSDIMEEADPCFARIIRGFNTMERIHRSNIMEEEASYRRKQHRMVHPVTIVSMRVQHTDHQYGNVGGNGQSQARR